MTRQIDPALQTELAQPSVQISHLVEMRFGSGTQYMTDAPVDISWGGNQYQRGQLLNVGQASETVELRGSQMAITTTAVDQSFVAIALGEEFFGRQVIVSRVAIRDGAVVGAPLTVFVGVLDDARITEDPETDKSIVTWTAEPLITLFDRPGGRQSTDDYQQKIFPGDRFFEFAQQIDIKIPWGRK